MRVQDAVRRALLLEKALAPVERLLYLCVLESQPRSLTGLAAASGISRPVVSRACGRLVKLGWLSTTGSSRRRRPFAAIPPRLQGDLAAGLEALYDAARNKGEFLMKCYLDVAVASGDFVDCARPGFLANPSTGEPLEYDRYYLVGVAFEFNGAQHYLPDASFQSLADHQALLERDRLKRQLSEEAGIKLVDVVAADLRPERLEELIPAELPAAPIHREGRYFGKLAKICRAYAAKAARAEGQLRSELSAGPPAR